MDSAKPLTFTGGAGGFFKAWIVSLLVSFIPFIGWAIAFNIMNKWLVGNLSAGDKKLVYKAKLGETFIMLFIGYLLTLVTLGIYLFWFVPKIYRFVAEHTSYDDGSAATEKSDNKAVEPAGDKPTEDKSAEEKPAEAAPAASATPPAEGAAAAPATPPSTPETPAAAPAAAAPAASAEAPADAQKPVVG